MQLDHFMIVCRRNDGSMFTMDLQSSLEAVVDTIPRAEGIWRVVHLEGDRAWNESEKAAMLWLERNQNIDPDKDDVPPFVRENAKPVLDNIRRDILASRPKADSGRLTLPVKTCPKCDGEGGWPINEDRPVRSSYCERHGETYYSNWEDCDECGGSGEIDDEEDGDGE
jgi:hypothetical protein